MLGATNYSKLSAVIQASQALCRAESAAAAATVSVTAPQDTGRPAQPPVQHHPSFSDQGKAWSILVHATSPPPISHAALSSFLFNSQAALAGSVLPATISTAIDAFFHHCSELLGIASALAAGGCLQLQLIPTNPPEHERRFACSPACRTWARGTSTSL